MREANVNLPIALWSAATYTFCAFLIAPFLTPDLWASLRGIGALVGAAVVSTWVASHYLTTKLKDLLPDAINANTKLGKVTSDATLPSGTFKMANKDYESTARERDNARNTASLIAQLGCLLGLIYPLYSGSFANSAILAIITLHTVIAQQVATFIYVNADVQRHGRLFQQRRSPIGLSQGAAKDGDRDIKNQQFQMNLPGECAI